MVIVSDPGLYALVLGSRKPEAPAFKLDHPRRHLQRPQTRPVRHEHQYPGNGSSRRGWSHASQALSRLDDDECSHTLIPNEGTSENPNYTIVSEPGLYAIVLGTQTPDALYLYVFYQLAPRAVALGLELVALPVIGLKYSTAKMTAMAHSRSGVGQK